MQTYVARYNALTLQTRLLVAVGIAVSFNAVYCLIYRYSSGNPATLFEAFSWGVINIAPWIAAIEIGRSQRSVRAVAFLLCAATALSLLLEIAVRAAAPDWFDLVRRVPAAVASMLILALLRVWHDPRARRMAKPSVDSAPFDYAQSAGNYVELHRSGARTRLIRSSLSALAREQDREVLRIHRQYAVSVSAISRIERNHVVLKRGERLPIGDRYRARLEDNEFLVPSSQSA